MLISKAYTVQMNLDVPDAERRVAEKASESFEYLIAQLKLASEHLDLILTPFSKIQSLDSDEVVEHRDILNKYKDNTREMFENIFKLAYSSVSLMSEFSTDSAVEELMGSFIANLKDLEKQVNYLLSIFSNLNNQDFKNVLVSSIESVKKEIAQLKQLINDRILEHIDTNILAKNWESLVNEQYHDKVKDKTPLVVQLYQEREKALQ